MSKAPEGVRFSFNYISHPELLPDSKRMRRRLGLLFHSTYNGSNLRNLLNKELGVALKAPGCANDYYWPRAMLEVELRDVLDTVTLLVGRLQKNGYNDVETTRLIDEVRRIFNEERVRYSVDGQGGVHLTVDAAFEQIRISSIQALTSKRYESVRHALQDAYQALDQVPPDGKLAVRNIFYSNECLFRLVFPMAHQLGKGELTKHLKPAIDEKYKGEVPAVYSAHKQLSQYMDWVSGAHFYRHEPGSEEPSQPPFEMAIHYLSTGTSWLRWLRTFDQDTV